MARKYKKVKVGHYRRRDGSKIKAHTRRVAVGRGAKSIAKERRARAKGQQRKAERSGDTQRVKSLRRHVKYYNRVAAGSKSGKRFSKALRKMWKRA